MTATAEVIDEREESTAEANGKAKRARIGLFDGNKYFFPANAEGLEECKKTPVYNATKTGTVDGFRPYTIKNGKAELVGYCLARNEIDAFGRFLITKGYTTELTDPVHRGRIATPKIDVNTVNLLKIMWKSNMISDVMDFLKASPQYHVHFELNKAQLAEVMGGVVEE